MVPRLLSGVFFILSWLSAIIIGRKNIRRYAPIAIFSIFLVTLAQVIAYHLDWWRLKNPIIPKLKSIEPSYLLGPFFIGTIGVFSLTYRFGFRVYMLTNLILDSIFSYIILPILEKVGLIQLEKLNRTGVNGIMLAIATVIYPFQKWQDGNSKVKRKFKKWYS